MEASALSSVYAGADGVSVKFRSTVPPNEKRAAVRAALERMDAEEAAAFSLRQQLEQLVFEGGSYPAVIHPSQRAGIARRCIFQVDAAGRMAAWPRAPAQAGAEGVHEQCDTSGPPYAFCFVDEIERVEVSAGALSLSERLTVSAEAEDPDTLSGWVWVEEKKKKTFVRRWAQLSTATSQLSWWHAPPEQRLPHGLGNLLLEITTEASKQPEKLATCVEICADTAGGQAEATSEWLGQRITVAMAEGALPVLLKTLGLLQVLMRSGSSDLAGAISLNCRAAVLATSELDARSVSASAAAEQQVTDIRMISEQLLVVMNQAEPTSPTASFGKPTATASVTGCNTSPPKSKRKDFEYTLRLDLAQPDSAGVSKYILGFKGAAGAATLQTWKEAFSSATGATDQMRLSTKGKMRKTGRAISERASHKVGLDRAHASESVCEVMIHFAAPAVVDAGAAPPEGVPPAAGAEDEKEKDSGARRRAGLGTEPLRLGFKTSVEAEELCTILSAQHERYLEARARILPQLRVVSQRLQQAFQGESEWDMAQLTSLWEQVFDGREYVQGTSEFATAKSWVSDGWRDMGFQNADPTTDLRAMGMLGVHCLLRFTEAHTAQVRAICDVTTSRAGSYPFALTGINLGKLMVDLLLLRDVQPQDITDAEDPGPTLLRCWQTPMVALFCQLPPETEDVFTDVFGTLLAPVRCVPLLCLGGRMTDCAPTLGCFRCPVWSGDSRLLVLGARSSDRAGV